VTEVEAAFTDDRNAPTACLSSTYLASATDSETGLWMWLSATHTKLFRLSMSANVTENNKQQPTELHNVMKHTGLTCYTVLCYRVS